MTEKFVSRRSSTRNRVRAIPLAAAAIAAPTILRHSTLAQQAEVRLAGWTSSDQETELFESVLQDMQAALPEIKLNYQVIPSDYATKIQTDIAAGSVADVFYVDSLVAPDYMLNGALLELDSFMQQDGVSPDDFYPGLIGSFQMDGKTYGLPKDWSPLGMEYNAQAFTDAGISAAPATWDELKAAAQALKDTAGEPRVVIPADIAREFAFHYGAGAKVISDDGTQIVVNSPEAATALDFYYGLYRDELATTHQDVGADWPGDALAKGLGDLIFEGNWVFPFLEANAPDLEYAIAEMPAGPAGKATLAFTVSFSAYAGTRQPEASWQVINYLTGPEGMAKWTSLGLAMPSRTGLADAWSQQYPERESFLASGEYAHGWQLGPGGQAFYNDANGDLQGLFAGTLDVPTTLQNWQTAAEERIQLGGGATPEASPMS